MVIALHQLSAYFFAAPGRADPTPYIALAGVLVGLLFRWWADLQAHKRELKKATYTKLVRSLTAAVQAISFAVDPRRPMSDVGEKFAIGLAPISSAQVVARLPLSKALTAVNFALLRLSQSLHFERAKLDPLHEEYLFLETRFQRVVGEIDRRTEELEGRMVSHPQEIDYATRLRQLLASKVEEREHLRAAMRSKGEEAAKQVAICCRVLAEGMRGYPELITAVISEIRRELGFRFDRKAFLALQRQANDLAQELMGASIEEIHRRNGLASGADRP